MRHRRVSAVLAGAFAVLSASAVAGDDLADLKATHEQSLKAIVTNDVDQLFAIFHEEEVRFPRNAQLYTDSRGVDREELRKQIVAAAGTGDSHSITPVDLHYRVFGDTGVVWGYNIDIHKAKDGQGTVVKSQVTSIYSRTGGKWRRVCTHISAVPPAN